MVARRVRQIQTEPTVRIICADVVEGLHGLPDESVHCVVTSPPYWGLRDYGTATWEGGDPVCDHLGPPMRTRGGLSVGWDSITGDVNDDTKAGDQRSFFREVCNKCGARRVDSQVGLEPSPEEYVVKMVEVFREVRRVLRKDGTVWLNLGDSYAGGGRGGNPGHSPHIKQRTNRGSIREVFAVPDGLKSKELVGVPWRVALALQADGWYLRQDIIWSKPNPMPESVTDRCTKAHEYIFLLTKSARYYYDAVAIAEDGNPANYRANATIRDVPLGQTRQGKLDLRRGEVLCNTRNKRSVWTVAGQPYADAHFATFPPALIEPCIQAGTSAKGCCLDCGAPWERVVERKAVVIRRSDRTHTFGQTMSSGTQEAPAETRTEGWYPSCRCAGHSPLPDYPDAPPEDVHLSVHRAHRFEHWRVATTRAALLESVAATPTVPATVLDPFGGAGTTGLVSLRRNRSAILLDLNPQYCAMAAKRIREDSPFLAKRVSYV